MNSAVKAAIAAVTGLITGLVSGIGTIVSSFGSFFTGLFTGNFLASIQGLFGGILTGLGQIGGAFASAFTALHAGLLAGIQGIAGSIPLFGPALSTFTGTSAFAGALKLGLIGLTFQGTGKLLDTLGLSPKILQTLISGGKLALGIGLLATGNPLGLGFIGSSVGELLALHTTLPPLLTNVISIGATALGAFAGGFIDIGTIGGAIQGFQSALPFLSMDLASAGLVGIGDVLGLDWRITALIGIPIMASVGGLINGLTNGTGPGSIFNSIKDALLSGQTLGGLVSIGSAVALDALGAPPIATNFISNFLGSIAVGLSGGSSGGGGPGDIETRGQSILSKIGEGLQKFGRGLINVVGSVISFGQKVIQGIGTFTAQGFKKAIGAFSSIFSRQTQEDIYVDEAGLRGAAVTQNGDGWTWQNGSSRIDYNTVTGELTEGFGIGGQARVTGLGQDQGGNMYYRKLTYEKVINGGAILNQTYENGRLTGWTYGIEGGPIVTVKGPGNQNPWMTTDGWIEEGNIEIRIPGPEEENPNPDPQAVFSLFESLVFAATIKDGQVENARVELKTPPGSQNGSGQTANQITDLVLLNGFEPELRGALEGTVPQYFSNNNPFRNRLNELGLSDDRIKTVPLFGGLSLIDDALAWLKEIGLTTEIKAAFNQIQRQNAGKPFVALANSGGGEPLVNALAGLSANTYSVKTAILLGCPVTTRVLTAQSPLERIINVYGQDDYFLPEHLDQNPARLAGLLDIDPPTISGRFFHQGHDFDTINIEFKGIGHEDYLYSSADTPTELQRKSNDFIAVLTSRSIRESGLETFLQKLVSDGQATLTEETSTIDGRRNRVRTYVVDLEDWSDQ